MPPLGHRKFCFRDVGCHMTPVFFRGARSLFFQNAYYSIQVCNTITIKQKPNKNSGTTGTECLSFDPY